MSSIVLLEFINPLSVPEIIEVTVSRASVEDIMQWYGGFYAGDDYRVMINGREVPIDLNGEYEHDTIEGTVG